jgi:hypothetical protein
MDPRNLKARQQVDTWRVVRRLGGTHGVVYEQDSSAVRVEAGLLGIRHSTWAARACSNVYSRPTVVKGPVFWMSHAQEPGGR